MLRLVAAVFLLLAGLALAGRTVYTLLSAESVNAKPAVTLVTDPAELKTRQLSVEGSYATGDKPGDRTISVQPDGKVIFTEIGSTNRVLNNTDTYRIGRREKQYCLTTPDSGLIEIVDIDTLIYYRDTYQRK